MPTPMENYLFDLRGYLILEDVLTADEVAELNACIDNILPIEPDEWDGYIRAQGKDQQNIQLHQIYEAGKPFENLIDHPGWIDKVQHFVGGEGTFDHWPSPLFIDENFVIIREAGKATPMHSGGYDGVKRTQFRYRNGRFQCGQINILLALTDMLPGDGATMVIPGSHKSNFPHPQSIDRNQRLDSLEAVVGAVEVNIRAGSAILFVDALAHGSARRTNPGQRRVCIYRYGPGWGNFRHGYQPSPELLDRLTPAQRKIVQPQDLLPREPQKSARSGS